MTLNPAATRRRRLLLTLVVLPGLWLVSAGLAYAGAATGYFAPPVAGATICFITIAAVLGIAIVGTPETDARQAKGDSR